MINIKMQSTAEPNMTPNIRVLGIGGAGVNAVDNMERERVEGCEFIICNTDQQSLNNSPCANKISLGVNVTGGLGAGANPEVGRAAAEESLEDVLQHVDGANMVFVTAGMGGGTGTGAAPVIAKACRERGILTVGVVTKPFHFEGAHRMKAAEAGIEEMQKYVDTLIVIPNQNLFRIANEKTTFAEAFKMADGVLQSGVRGVTDLMVRPGLVNLDFADIRTAMMEMGKAMMGTGEATGEKRAIEAAEAAINNPLLDDVSMKGARGVIINVTGGYDMTLFEADEACNRIRDEVDPDANIIFGATFDESMDGAMRVSIVATGIDSASAKKINPQSGSGGNGLKRAVPHTTTTATGTTGMAAAGTASTAASGAGVAPAATQPHAPVRQSVPPQPAQPATPPPMSSSPVMPPQSTQPATPSTPLPADMPAAADVNLDMFEQSEFAGSEAHGVPPGAMQNTALRGTRYKNAFIPPKPAMAAPGSRVHSTTTTDFHGMTGSAPQASAPAATPPSGSGLKLNPPKLPTASEYKPAPSLIARITDSVQQKIEDIKHDYAPKPRDKRATPPAMTAPGGQTPDPGSDPAQRSLNIDAPSQPEKTDGDLDIPAFLRRQAN